MSSQSQDSYVMEMWVQLEEDWAKQKETTQSNIFTGLIEKKGKLIIIVF